MRKKQLFSSQVRCGNTECHRTPRLSPATWTAHNNNNMLSPVLPDALNPPPPTKLRAPSSPCLSLAPHQHLSISPYHWTTEGGAAWMTVPRRGGYERRDQSLPRFSALASPGLGLERSPGSIVTTPARSLAWPNTAQCTRRDCKTFLRNIPAIYGMWLVTLLLLYSFQEGMWSVYFFAAF